MFKKSLILILLILSGCGIIDNKIRTDNNIKEKTAFALGTTANKITIMDRKGDLDSVHFNAKVNNKIFQCYYSTAGISSDVLCAPTDGSKLLSSPNCNALLRAAGQCE